MDLKIIGCEVVDYIYLAQGRIYLWAVENTAMNPPVSIQGGSFFDQPSDCV
jgi:hypothetical protein